jgi:pimeloyl-ACP methyl ester carboxylesterase
VLNRERVAARIAPGTPRRDEQFRRRNRLDTGAVSLVYCLALVLVAGLASCRRKGHDAAPIRASASAGTSAAPKRVPLVLQPLHAESWRIDLPVEGFGPASVAVPLGAREPRPILIALHGYADRPDWQCGTWRGISPVPFVLCPRGEPLPSARGQLERFTYRDGEQVERELRAALRALKQRFKQYVASGPVILTGYSLGAIHAAKIARQEPSFFSRLVLVEGAADRWSAGDAAVFAKGGGQKLMIVCAQGACAAHGKRAVLFTTRARADAELVHPGELGHLFDGRVAAAIKQRFDWLVSGDARWSPTRSRP